MKPHSTTGLWRCGVAIWRNTLTAAWEPMGHLLNVVQLKLPTARKYYAVLRCVSPQLIESERAGEDKEAFWVSSLRQLGQTMTSVPQDMAFTLSDLQCGVFEGRDGAIQQYRLQLTAPTLFRCQPGVDVLGA